MSETPKAVYNRWRQYPAKMTPEEALAALAALEGEYDIEVIHSQADEVLCSLLRFYGQDDVVEAWGRIDKWYA